MPRERTVRVDGAPSPKKGGWGLLLYKGGIVVSENRLLYLSYSDVQGLGVTMAEVIEALESAFREKGKGKVEMPPKPGVHPTNPDNFIHAMPAYIPALGSAGVKWVAGYPENYKRGLPYITGLLILNDVETGLPLAVMDWVWITAMRTGAATARAMGEGAALVGVALAADSVADGPRPLIALTS